MVSSLPKRARLASSVVLGAVVAALLAWSPSAPAVAASQAAAVTSHPGIFHPLTPARILDTTAAAGGTVSVTAVGANGVPATGVGAVVLNVTAARPVHGGYVTVYPFGSPRPPTSNLNVSAGSTVANLVTVPVGTNGKVSLYNASTGSTRLVADISGYYEAGTPVDPGAFHSLAPTRVLDTRSSLGAPPSAATSLATASVQIAGVGGVPPSGASAVILNVTVATPQASGFATVFPSGGTRPGTSTLNFPAGRTVPNLVAVKLGTDGKVNFYNGSLGSVRFVADVFGYYLDGTPTRAGTFTSLAPARIMDTRHGLGASSILGPHGTVWLDVNSKGGLPPYGGGAVALNVTVTGASASGYLTVYPTTAPRPRTSNLNFVRGQTVANLVVVRAGDDGHIYFTNSSTGSVHIIADVSGSFVPVPAIHFRGSEAISDTMGETSVSCPSVSLCLASMASGRVAQYDGSTWSTPQSLFPGDEVVAVSCATTTSCVAVSRLGDSRTFNGTSWSTHIPLGAAAGFGLQRLSCPTATFCLTTGWDDGKLRRFNGSTWSTMTIPTATFIDELSCVSATFCVAVDDISRAYRFNGSTWSTPTTLGEAPVGLSCVSSSFCLYTDELGEFQTFDGSVWSSVLWGGGGDRASSTSCASSTFCVAGGKGVVRTYNGAGWSGVALDSGVQSVACPTVSFCVAMGSEGAAATFDGTSWSATVPVDPIVGSATAVSCAAAPFCMVVTDTGVAVTRGASGWTAATSVQPGVPLTGVSCASSQFCVAVGGGSASRFNGSSWSAPVLLDAGVNLNRVDCPTTTFCLATNGGNYAVFNGTSWSASTPVLDPAGGGQSAMTSLTCPTATYCAMARFDGTVREWTGTVGAYWAAAAPTGLQIGPISCVSASFCAASDEQRDAAIRTGATWSVPELIGGGEAFNQMSCRSTTMCVTTAGNSSNAYTYDGEVWTLTGTSPIRLGLMSCGSPTFCLGVEGTTATVGTPT